jgi:hypothetical protein
MANKILKPRKIRKYNWLELRQEYIHGEWKNLNDFLKDKGMPAYYRNNKHMAGLATEKKDYVKNVIEQAAEKSLEEDIKDATKVRLRQARLARFMQLRGAEALKDPSLKIQSAEDARKLLTSGLEQERKALGIDGGGDKPNSLTQININAGPKTQLDRMLEGASYEDILGLIAELKRAREGSVAGEIIDDSSTEAEGVI